MCTPVTARDGDVDVEALREYTSFLIENGVHGLFPCGSTGEFSSLTPEQRYTVIETVVETAESIPVLAGCGGTSVTSVRRYVHDAAEVGADAAVVITPYYLATTQQGLLDFYEQVAEDAPLPIIIYHIPELTGQDLSVESIVQLAADESIIGIKDTSRDLVRLYEIIERTPDSFLAFQGATTLAVPSLELGADGLIPTSANVFPKALAEVYDASVELDRARANNVMSQVVCPFISAFSEAPPLSAIKHLVGRVGPDIGPPLPPLPELTTEEKETLEAATSRLQIA